MRFNQILIVDSIPHGEQNTARQLRDDVKLRADVYAPSPAVLYMRIESAMNFLALLEHLVTAVTEFPIAPILHIECHGSVDGLAFADGSTLTWLELKPKLTELNIAMKLSLLVVVSACEGSAITRTLGLIDRAPLWGLIGPRRIMGPDELYEPYLAFYETLLRTKSAPEAVDALRNALPDVYVFRTAEWTFQYIWNHYQKTHETAEARLERAAYLYPLLPEAMDRPTVQEIAEIFRVRNPEFFSRFRRRFFMCDLFPEHEQRFNVRYEPEAAC